MFKTGPNYKIILISLLSVTLPTFAAQNYSVLNANQYQHIFMQSRAQIQTLLTHIKPYRQFGNNAVVAYLAQQFADKPYLYQGSVGEGDWQPTAKVYRGGALHVSQYPVYRLDGFDCQSLVEVLLAFLKSHSLAQFDNNFLKIAYGAAGNPNGEIVHYYNRNNFIDEDFNPINRQNKFIADVTSDGELAGNALITSTTISKQKWFTAQQNNLSGTIHVLNPADGSSMVQRFAKVYSHLTFPGFSPESVAVSYLPKSSIAMRQGNGYIYNEDLLASIPTPAIVEIVRNPRKWFIGSASLKSIIGTDLNISHIGIVYRQMFHQNQLIYRKISCYHNQVQQPVCQVQPVMCQQSNCLELMFVHATDAHPSGYFWYKSSDGNYQCTDKPPRRSVPYSYCNRVERIPLAEYLTGSQHGWYMTNASYLGIHVEKILN